MQFMASTMETRKSLVTLERSASRLESLLNARTRLSKKESTVLLTELWMDPLNLKLALA